MSLRVSLSVLTFSLLVGCGSSSNSTSSTTAPVPITPSQPSTILQESVHINQIGYLPVGEKVAIIPSTSASRFELINTQSNEVSYQGELTVASPWQPAGSIQVKKADFSNVETPGDYLLRIDGVEDKAITILDSGYHELHDAALKYYYLNRSSTEITQTFGQQWARALGHPDTQVTVHDSAASQARPAGYTFASAKGWYDAGDFGKYVVNSGIATYTLLAAYEHYPSFYQGRQHNIPESNNEVPDILDEIKWNLDWLETMQDDDGSVYHKLTTLDWPGKEMPVEDTRPRYVIGKSTAAALDFSATLAVASRVYQPFSAQFPGLSERWLSAAKRAYQWALSNPNLAYIQPDDVSSGEYGDSNFEDEFAWAAAELYITTQEVEYLEAFQQQSLSPTVPEWPDVSSLGYISLLRAGQPYLSEQGYQDVVVKLTTLADELLLNYQQSAYAVAMTSEDFVWGSNSAALNRAMILLQAYEMTQESQYKDAAIGTISYLLGRNPTGFSFVTGFGTKTPMDPHHRASYSDGIPEPLPGMVVGGPQNGQQDQCEYPSNTPAMSYIDDWCSYSTNEVAINWNAPLVYVLAALMSE